MVGGVPDCKCKGCGIVWQALCVVAGGCKKPAKDHRSSHERESSLGHRTRWKGIVLFKRMLVSLRCSYLKNVSKKSQVSHLSPKAPANSCAFTVLFSLQMSSSPWLLHERPAQTVGATDSPCEKKTKLTIQ